MIIHGDATNQNILLEEGIQNSEAFVSLTGIDEGNIFLSLFAQSAPRQKSSPRSTGFPLGISLMTSAWQSDLSLSLLHPNILQDMYVPCRILLATNVETLYHLIENKVEAPRSSTSMRERLLWISHWKICQSGIIH